MSYAFPCNADYFKRSAGVSSRLRRAVSGLVVNIFEWDFQRGAPMTHTAVCSCRHDAAGRASRRHTRESLSCRKVGHHASREVPMYRCSECSVTPAKSRSGQCPPHTSSSPSKPFTAWRALLRCAADPEAVSGPRPWGMRLRMPWGRPRATPLSASGSWPARSRRLSAARRPGAYSSSPTALSRPLDSFVLRPLASFPAGTLASLVMLASRSLQRGSR